eukprot:2316578-Rhodomonas_salina.3
MMPPTISGGDDDEMGGEIGGQESKPELDLTEAQKEEETRKKEAKEMEEAKVGCFAFRARCLVLRHALLRAGVVCSHRQAVDTVLVHARADLRI